MRVPKVAMTDKLDAAIRKAAKTPGRPVKTELHQPKVKERDFQAQVIRLARVRRGIEREARRGGRCVDVLVGPYARAMALSDYLSDYGYHTVVNTIGNDYKVRVSW